MSGDIQARLGRNLRAYRLAHGMSQEAFADHLRFHRTYMGGVERGERNLTLRSVERIADRAGVDARALLDPDFDAAALPPPRSRSSRARSSRARKSRSSSSRSPSR